MKAVLRKAFSASVDVMLAFSKSARRKRGNDVENEGIGDDQPSTLHSRAAMLRLGTPAADRLQARWRGRRGENSRVATETTDG